MKANLTKLSVFSAVLALIVAGCNTERVPGGSNRAILKAGQQVSADMVGWVAVPDTAPEVKTDKTLTYAVLTAHNVVPTKMDRWVAMPSTLFTKMSDIKVNTPNAPAVEKWVLKPEGKSVPKDKNGWVAVPNSAPQIESSANKKGLELATLAGDDVIPTEMNGWVAVDSETMAKLSEKYMMSGKGSKVSKD